MKIVHVLPFLTKGGGERVAADLANQAIQDGHDVSIIAAYPVDPSQLQNSLHKNIRVLFVSNAHVSKVIIYLKIVPWLWKNRVWLAEQDILHCHLTYGAVFGVVAVWLRRIQRLKCPAVLETYHSVGMPMSSLGRWFHARLGARLDAFVLMAQDDHWSAFLKQRPTLLSAIIPNGVSFNSLIRLESKDQLTYRRQIGIPDDCSYIVGTVGRLSPERKPWLYISIFAALVKIFGEKIHFIIGGDGVELDRIRLLVSEYGLEKQVHLIGLVLEPRLPISIMDLYLTLNVGAITGIAALEAAYLHTPVVAIQLLSDREPRSEDWIWSDPEPANVAKKAIDLLSDRATLDVTASTQASHVRTHFTVGTMSRSYYDIYQKALRKTACVE